MGKLIPYLFVFAGFVVAVIALPGVYDTLSLAWEVQEFEAADALVTSKNRQKHQKGPDTIDVQMEFRTKSGQAVRADNRYTRLSDDADEVERAIRREGGVDRVRIWYDPQNPRRVALTQDIHVLRPALILVFVAVAILGGIHAVVIDRKRIALQKRGEEARRKKELAQKSSEVADADG